MGEVKTLRFDTQVRALTELARLVDRSEAYSKALQAAGYKSFLAPDAFDRSFCEQGEFEEHRRCQIEAIKKGIETPDGVLLRRSDRESASAKDSA